ncbi:MAG: hypothetical protein IT416_02255 [Candidatus Pacebacteria bacterium]|nr:hypothetical protein [Candidatus Paceibacterota bacterium]
MFTNYPKTSTFIIILLLVCLSGCQLGAQTPSLATNTPEPTSTPEVVTPLPTRTKQGTVVALTATDLPTGTPSATPTSAINTYNFNDVLGPYNAWTLLNAGGKTVIVAPNYQLEAPAISEDNKLTLVQLKPGDDRGDAFAAAADLFPNNSLYYSPLEISGMLPGTVKRGLPEGWSYYTAPLGTWTDVTANADWYQSTFVSLKGMILEAEKAKTQPDIIWLDEAQFASFMLTCEKGKPEYPGIKDQRSVFQVFVNPGQKFNFAEVCPAGMVNGSGYVYTSLRGSNASEKEAWAIQMANAYLELMFSRQTLQGKPSSQLYLDNEKGGASNFARIWIGDQRFAPAGFKPPLATWLTAE